MLTAKNENFSKKVFFPVSYAQITCKEHRTPHELSKSVSSPQYSLLLLEVNRLSVRSAIELNVRSSRVKLTIAGINLRRKLRVMDQYS